LAAFESKRGELAELGVSVWAASVDAEEKTNEVRASGISFPLGWGVSRELADRLGSWWDESRGYMQPAELIFRRDGRIVQSSYSSGPLARTDPADVISLLRFLIERARKKEASAAGAGSSAAAPGRSGAGS
jgi:peroxiredoxin